jgi:hypothetical protein
VTDRQAQSCLGCLSWSIRKQPEHRQGCRTATIPSCLASSCTLTGVCCAKLCCMLCYAVCCAMLYAVLCCCRKLVEFHSVLQRTQATIHAKTEVSEWGGVGWGEAVGTGGWGG